MLLNIHGVHAACAVLAFGDHVIIEPKKRGCVASELSAFETKRTLPVED